MNTTQRGHYRWMIFKDAASGEWVGVALEFNIVVTGDDPQVVEAELTEAVVGYLESAKKAEKGFRPEHVNAVLNQSIDEEYEMRWKANQGSFAALR